MSKQAEGVDFPLHQNVSAKYSTELVDSAPEVFACSVIPDE